MLEGAVSAVCGFTRTFDIPREMLKTTMENHQTFSGLVLVELNKTFITCPSGALYISFDIHHDMVKLVKLVKKHDK